MSPVALNLVKNSLAFTLMIPTLLLIGAGPPQLPAQTLAVVLVSGILGIALADTLYFMALNQLGASRMGIVGGLFSPFVVALSIVFLGERLSGIQAFGFAVVLFGVFLATAKAPRTDLNRSELLKGLLIGASAVLTMAIGIVMVKRALEQHSFLWIVELRLLGGVAGLILVVLMRRRMKPILTELRQPHHWPQIITASVLGSYLALIFRLQIHARVDCIGAKRDRKPIYCTAGLVSAR